MGLNLLVAEHCEQSGITVRWSLNTLPRSDGIADGRLKLIERRGTDA